MSVVINCVHDCFSPNFCQGFASRPLHIDEQQQQIVLVDGTGHVEAFRADRSELLVLVVSPIEQFLEVQELQVHFEGM